MGPRAHRADLVAEGRGTVSEKSLDVICLGRAAVDLYGEQIGSTLEQAQSFAKYVGGCAANIAVGTSALGLKVAMLTKVGDEHMGRFVRAQLQAEGVDVRHVKTDPKRLTGLVLLSIKDQDTFPLLFYRENCADMALEASEVDESFIASAKALVVTGTHFSKPNVAEASRAAMKYARAHGTKVVLDIDYRPVLWGLTGVELGEQRYVKSDQVTAHLQSILPGCDVVVGTEEEFHIAGGTTDTMAALRAVRQKTPALLVLKRGPKGCAVFEGAIPQAPEEGVTGKAFAVEVLNVLGAGDAFMSGFLSGYLRGRPLADCCTRANACGALVVSRHGCAPAMPSASELEYFLTREGIDAQRDEQLNHLHRVTRDRPKVSSLLVFALDNRLFLEELARKHGRPLTALRTLKQLLAQGARKAQQQSKDASLGVLIDDRWGDRALWESGNQGLWLSRPVERSGDKPLAFENGPELGLWLKTWPKAHVAKVLWRTSVSDEQALKDEELKRLHQLAQACAATDRQWLLEILPQMGKQHGQGELQQIIRDTYRAGLKPDWWKLEPQADVATWRSIAELIDSSDPHCLGTLVLGGGTDWAGLERAFAAAAPVPQVRGFAVGRTIFGPPSEAWLKGELDDDAVVAQSADTFLRTVALWRKHRSV